MKSCNRTIIFLYSISLVVSLLMGILINHLDLYVISGWGVEFARCVLHNDIKKFASACIESTGQICNYSMFFNILGGIWEFPIVLIEFLNGTPIDIMVYCIWFKILIIIFFALSVKELYEICVNVPKFESNKHIIITCFATASIVQIPILGIGQVDGISMYFCLLAYRKYVEGKKRAIPFLIAFAYLIKPWCMILYYPIIILYIYREVKHLLNILCGVLLPILLNLGLDRLIMGDYYDNKADVNNEFLLRFVDISVNGWSVFCFVLFGVLITSIYLCVTKEYSIEYAMILSLIVFIFFYTFFPWHPQYLVYGLPIVLYAIFYLFENCDKSCCNFFYLLLYVMINCAFTEIMICNFSVKLAQYGIVGYISKHEYAGQPMIAYFQRFFLYINEACITMISASLVFILCIFLKKYVFGRGGQKNSKGNDDKSSILVSENSTNRYFLCVGFNILIIALYIFGCMYLYIRDLN